MRHASAALACAVTAGSVGWPAGTDTGHRALELKAAAPSHSVLGVRHGRRSSWLARVDARTLRYTRGRQLNVGAYGSGWSFSPDRALLALGSFQPGVLLVETRRLRVVARIPTGPTGQVLTHAWVGSRLLVVLGQCCENDQTSIAVVDPVLRRVISRVDLAGSLEGVARARRALVLLLGPSKGIGPSRLVVGDPEGHVRSVGIERIHSGRDTVGDGVLTGRHARPALAVDPATDRAYVIGAGAPVAEVDLGTLAVGYQELSASVSLLGRLRGWLEPVAEAKAPPVGPTRSAAWLGDGLLAISGFDIDARIDGPGALQLRSIPAGLKLIDTRNWEVRTLDARTSSFVVANGRLLAWSWLWDSPPIHVIGTGLRAYGPDGAVRFHLFGSQPILGVSVFGTRAIVGRGVSGMGRTLVDIASRRVVRSLGVQVPQLLVGAELSEWSGGASPASAGI